MNHAKPRTATDFFNSLLGAYVGETIRRRGGGIWKGDDSDPAAEINVELQLPNGIRMWPVQRVMKRLRNGDSDLIYPYGVAALEFGQTE